MTLTIIFFILPTNNKHLKDYFYIWCRKNHNIPQESYDPTGICCLKSTSLSKGDNKPSVSSDKKLTAAIEIQTLECSHLLRDVSKFKRKKKLWCTEFSFNNIQNDVYLTSATCFMNDICIHINAMQFCIGMPFLNR